MRGFIVLCMAAVAVAAPQGYNYNPAPQAFNTASSSTGFVNAAPQQSYFAQQPQQVQLNHHQQQQVQLPQQQLQPQQQQQQQQQQQAVVSKRFFIHTAPEEAEEDLKERYITVGVPRKNYNVVFIKAAARANKKTAIKIAPAVNEEKTVIYVLNKKTDASDVQAEVIEQSAPTSKPEVFFIKYKTNEEAQHAQREIQAQYDALGGSSQVTDEGVAPVTSVIGSLGDNGAAAVAGGAVSTGGSYQQNTISHSSSSSIGGATNNAYLPPNF